MSEEKVFYGLDAEIHEKMMAKLDPETVQKAIEWIATITEEPLNDLYPSLKNGVQLCKLLNKIKPGTVKKFKEKPTHVLTERENVQAYLDGCAALGVPSHELFTISDLQEGKSIPSVLLNIYSLGRIAQVTPGFDGPRLGVKYTVTLEEQEKRRAKKALEAMKSYKMAQVAEKMMQNRRESLEREKRIEAITDRKANEEKVLMRKLRKGRLTEKEYQQCLDKINAQYEKDLANPEGAEVDIGAVVFGMDYEHQKKMREKMDQEETFAAAEQIMDWLEDMVGVPIDDIHKNLRTGVVLCELINKLRPGYIKKIDKRAYTSLRFGPSVSRDNIKQYLGACERMGVPRSELFGISDLYDAKDIAAVMKNLDAVRRMSAITPKLEPITPIHTVSVPELPKPPTVVVETQSEPRLPVEPAAPSQVEEIVEQQKEEIIIEKPQETVIQPPQVVVIEQPQQVTVEEVAVPIEDVPAEAPKKSNFKRNLALGLTAGLIIGAGIYVAVKKPELPRQIMSKVLGFFGRAEEDITRS